MQFTENNTTDLLELFRWRRDVRHFKKTPLTDSEIKRLAKAISLSPSVGNSRPWRVVKVSSPAIRERIITNNRHANTQAEAIYENKKLQDYQALKLEGLKEAPLQLAIFTEMEPKAGHGLGRQTMPETLSYSTITAIHQLWLIARTMNIGVGWVSILKPEEMNKILDVEKSWKFTAYLCIGYPQNEHEMPELHRSDWQKNEETEWIER